VTFTVLQGSTIIGSPVTSGTVSNGQANAIFSLPAGTVPGSYTIESDYHDATNVFATSSGTASLIVKSAAATSGVSSSSAGVGPPSAGFVGLAIEEFALTLDSVLALIEGALGIPHASLDEAMAQLHAAIANDPLLSTPEDQLAIMLGQSAAFDALSKI
jgi:hypothetical protein